MLSVTVKSCESLPDGTAARAAGCRNSRDSALAPADLLGDSAEKQGVCVGAGQFSVFAGGVQAEQRAVGGLFFVGCFTGDLP